jgi:hypothetical protein
MRCEHNKFPEACEHCRIPDSPKYISKKKDKAICKKTKLPHNYIKSESRLGKLFSDGRIVIMDCEDCGKIEWIFN